MCHQEIPVNNLITKSIPFMDTVTLVVANSFRSRTMSCNTFLIPCFSMTDCDTNVMADTLFLLSYCVFHLKYPQKNVFKDTY